MTRYTAAADAAEEEEEEEEPAVLHDLLFLLICPHRTSIIAEVDTFGSLAMCLDHIKRTVITFNEDSYSFVAIFDFSMSIYVKVRYDRGWGGVRVGVTICDRGRGSRAYDVTRI